MPVLDAIQAAIISGCSPTSDKVKVQQAIKEYDEKPIPIHGQVLTNTNHLAELDKVIGRLQQRLDYFESRLSERAHRDTVQTAFMRHFTPAIPTDRVTATQLDSLIRENQMLRENGTFFKEHCESLAKKNDDLAEKIRTLEDNYPPSTRQSASTIALLEQKLADATEELRAANFAYGKFKERHTNFLAAETKTLKLKYGPTAQRLDPMPFELFIDAFLANYDRMLQNETELCGPPVQIIAKHDLGLVEAAADLVDCIKAIGARMIDPQVCEKAARLDTVLSKLANPTPTLSQPPAASAPSPSTHSESSHPPSTPSLPPDTAAPLTPNTPPDTRTPTDSHHTADTAQAPHHISDKPSSPPPNPPGKHPASAGKQTSPSPHTQAPKPVSLPPPPNLVSLPHLSAQPHTEPTKPSTSPDSEEP